MKKILLFVVALLASINMAFAAVNLNTASQAELETLKGVGPAKAKAIIEDRTKNGPFKSVDDLERVKGFSKKSVHQLRNELTINGSNAPADTGKPMPMEKPTAK